MINYTNFYDYLLMFLILGIKNIENQQIIPKDVGISLSDNSNMNLDVLVDN